MLVGSKIVVSMSRKPPVPLLDAPDGRIHQKSSAEIAAAAGPEGTRAEIWSPGVTWRTAASASGGCVDQDDSQLLISVQSPWAMKPGGPPPGYNIVVNLAAPPLCWPPSQGAQTLPKLCLDKLVECAAVMLYPGNPL